MHFTIISSMKLKIGHGASSFPYKVSAYNSVLTIIISCSVKMFLQLLQVEKDTAVSKHLRVAHGITGVRKS